MSTPLSRFELLALALQLSPLATKVVNHIEKHGSISARDALLDLDITSASLARRVTEIIRGGIPVKRERKVHASTGKTYTRYVIENLEEKPAAAEPVEVKA